MYSQVLTSFKLLIEMFQNKLLKNLIRFSIAYFGIIVFVALSYCHCLPWDLLILLFAFYIIYLVASFWLREFFFHLGWNPMSYLIFSFFSKILIVISFAFFLVKMFDLEQKVTIFLYVIGYVIACVFDFLILEETTKKNDL